LRHTLQVLGTCASCLKKTTPQART
jgi:hypothetical protein